MNDLHPDITSITTEAVICPICRDWMEPGLDHSNYVCSNRYCYFTHHFRIYSNRFDIPIFRLEITIQLESKQLLYLEQDFVIRTTSLTVMPEHKNITIPLFPIDFNHIDTLPKKLQTYLTLL